METITGGVDTHSAVHCVAAVDSLGRLLGWNEFPASEVGYEELLGWLRRQGDLQSVGVEGTGAYGAGLARFLTRRGVRVLEVARPDRRQRRNRGKSDPLDAEAAARSVLAGTATVTPKGGDGPIEAIRALRVERLGAQKARTAGLNTLRGMVVTAPEILHEQLAPLRSGRRLLAACSNLRPDLARVDDSVQATKLALRTIARRVRNL